MDKLTDPSTVADDPRRGGAIAGRYTLEAPIGHGGSATVFRARDARTGRAVAVKLLDAPERHEPDAVTRFLLEARALARVTHANVVRLLDTGDAAREPFLVTELLEGETLAARLERASGPLALREVAALVLPLLEGLTAVHAAGVVHRDLKPANVFLHREADGRTVPKLVDFGIAKLFGIQRGPSASLMIPGSVFGTPHYISPEQAVDARAVDARTDVWAVGVLLYRLLVGRVPFDAPNVGELLGLVLATEPPTPAYFGAPESVSTVVMRCLEKLAVDRPADAGDLHRRLCDALGVCPAAAAWGSMPSLRVAPPPPYAVTARPPSRLTPAGASQRPVASARDPTAAAGATTPRPTALPAIPRAPRTGGWR